MAEETNEASLRGTTTTPQSRKGSWLKRLLKTVFWAVWVIDRALALITWFFGSSSG